MGLIKKIVFLLIFITYMRQVSSVSPLDTANIYQESGFTDPNAIKTAYVNGINQATQGVQNGNINDVISGLKAAAAADSSETFAQMINGQAFGRTNLAKTFPEAAQLESIITPVAQAFLGDTDSLNFINQYIDGGISDDNFSTAIENINTGLQTGDVQQILDAFKIVNTYPGDKYLSRLTTELADVGYIKGTTVKWPASTLGELLISKFNTEDVIKICNAAQLENADILAIYEASTKFHSDIENLQTAYDNNDATGMANVLSDMAKIYPNLTTKFFQKGNIFDYEALSESGFNTTQMLQISQAAGLTPEDIAAYLGDKYTPAIEIDDTALKTAIESSNLQDVINSITKLKSDGMTQNDLAKLFENEGPLSRAELLENAGFDEPELIKIAQAGGLSPADIDAYLAGNYTAAVETADQALETAIANKDFAGVSNALTQLETLAPTSTPELLTNASPLDEKYLANVFSPEELTQLATIVKLDSTETESYLAGDYTGASNLPSNTPSIPGGGPTNNQPSTGTGTQTGDNIPGAQEYYTLTEVTVSNLQQLITQNKLTKTEFNELLANQEANLAKLQKEGTASSEEIAEMTNEINISKQVANDPNTQFEPETVDPVIAP